LLSIAGVILVSLVEPVARSER